MIIEMNENEYKELKDKVIGDELTLSQSMPKGNCVKYYKMVSEDGTEFLQGVGAMQMFENDKCKVLGVWVDSRCRNIGFGSALLENMEQYAKDIASGMGTILSKMHTRMDSDNSVALFFEKNGYMKKVVGNNATLTKKF